ncbi:MAG: type II secretion system GspH family protein [Puniceicoccales bacterium]|nr:type II secretion system GspH family protein [Puniceicoccales bacterium]
MKKSFTLVEIVFTISIIGILLAVLLPAMSAIKLGAKKVRDMSNLKRIAEAWKECVVNRGWTFGTGNIGQDFWATGLLQCLAGVDRTSPTDIVLNDPHVYVSPGDKYASKIVKEMICQFDEGERKIVAIGTPWGGGLPFSVVNSNLFSGNFLLSYCIIAHGPVADIPLETTPLAFTRGLCTDGTWDEEVGLYGSKGGYVVFGDGHVTWFDGSQPAKFLKWDQDQSGYTTDIRYAVPPGAMITCCGQDMYKGNNSNLIFWDYGKEPTK